MTFNGKDLRIPGWFIATVTLVLAIVGATWRLSRQFNEVLVEHREYTAVMRRLDRRSCRMEEALRSVGARITPDVECYQRGDGLAAPAQPTPTP